MHAAVKVFGTAELLEPICVNIQMQDLLMLQRISSFSKKGTSASSKLQGLSSFTTDSSITVEHWWHAECASISWTTSDKEKAVQQVIQTPLFDTIFWPYS